MNASLSCRTLAALLLTAPASVVVAAEPPVVEVAPIRAVLLSFDCQHRALPTQREVGEALGQYNFSQVYASRERLMTEVGRTCQRPGTDRVELVVQPMAAPNAPTRRLAMLEPAPR